MLPVIRIFFLVVLLLNQNPALSLLIDSQKKSTNLLNDENYELISKSLDNYIKNNSADAVDFAKDVLKKTQKFDLEDKIPIQYKAAVIFEKNGHCDLAYDLFSEIISNSNDSYYLLESYLHVGLINKRRSNFNDAHKYYIKAFNLSLKTNSRKHQARALNRLGVLKKVKNELDSAKIYYDKSIEIFEELEDEKGIARNYNNLGILHKNYGEYLEAYSYYSKAIEIFKEINDNHGLGSTYMHLAILYKNLKRYDEAKDFYEQSYQIRKKINDVVGLITLLLHLSVLEKHMLEYDKAIMHLAEADSLNRAVTKSKKKESEIYVRTGSLFDTKGEYFKAIEYYERGLKTKQELEEKIAVANITYYLGRLKIKTGSKEEGLVKLLQAYEILESFDALIQNVELTDHIAKAYESLSDYENANKYLRKYIELKERLSSHEFSKTLFQTNLELALEKKDKKLKEIQIANQENTRNFLIAISLLVIILLILTYARYRARHKSSEILKKKNEEIKLKNEELEQVVYIASHDIKSPLFNIQGFSQEIIRIAREEVKYLENAKEKLDIEKIKDALENCIMNYSQHNINSTNKLDGLLGSLLELSRIGNQDPVIENLNMDNLIDEVKRSFEYQLMESDIDFIADKLHNIKGDYFQISQLFSNLVGNSIKYKSQRNDKMIKIYSEENEKYNYYNFEDNGVGIGEDKLSKIFDVFYQTSKENEGHGIGLSIIKKVVDKHKGQIEVQSKEGIGTKFIIKLPKNL